MLLEIFGNSMLVENLARTLLHSVWQIGLIGFCLFLVLRLTTRSNANLRYMLSVSALSFCLILPVSTFFYFSQFSFYTGKNQIVSAETNKNILREQTQTADEYFADEKVVANSAKTETAISVNGWQNTFNRFFSDYSPIVVAFWFLGILLFSMRLFGGFRKLHELKTKEISDADFKWQIKFTRLCEKLKITQNVRLLKSDLVESPMVIGWLKPVILVPASVFWQIDTKQLETILAHELMHIRRFDFPVNFAQSFVEILFFYHPCVWWISKEIRRERECACDDAVLQILDNAKFTYANALANLEELREKNNPQLQVAANGGNLMNRIKRILEKDKTRESFENQNSLWPASLASSLLILAFMLTLFCCLLNKPLTNMFNFLQTNLMFESLFTNEIIILFAKNNKKYGLH